MKRKPTTHGSTGQGPDGKFLPGNKLGKGNPLAGRAAQIRARLLARVSDDDVDCIMDQLIAKAKGGDLLNIRELLDRVIGRTSTTDLIERIEKLEQVADALLGKESQYEW